MTIFKTEAEGFRVREIQCAEPPRSNSQEQAKKPINCIFERLSALKIYKSNRFENEFRWQHPLFLHARRNRPRTLEKFRHCTYSSIRDSSLTYQYSLATFTQRQIRIKHNKASLDFSHRDFFSPR